MMMLMALWQAHVLLTGIRSGLHVYGGYDNDACQGDSRVSARV